MRSMNGPVFNGPEKNSFFILTQANRCKIPTPLRGQPEKLCSDRLERNKGRIMVTYLEYDGSLNGS